MPLHPEAAAFLQQIARQKGQSIENLPIELTRRAALLGSSASPDPPVLDRIENRTIVRPDGTELPIRVYVPVRSPLAPALRREGRLRRESRDEKVESGPDTFPVCLYFHGGGWVLNNIDTHDDLVRRLAAASGCVFVNVDYRLAPENKYPAALEDAWLTLNRVHQHADDFYSQPGQIAVAGDSAGGNLAAAVCLMSRDRHGPEIAFQALIYPITDCDFERPSYRENAEGFFLTRREMIWFWNHYVSSPEQMREAYASPLRAESLRDLPPVLILTAEYDPLRDEGEAYAAALRDAGVDVTLFRFDGMIHAFVRRVDQFSTAYLAIQKIAERLQQVFQIRLKAEG